MKKIIDFALAVFLTACSALPEADNPSPPVEMTAQLSTVIAETPGPPPTAGPSPTPVPATMIPTLPTGFSPTELKYQVLEEFPDFFFCDPDFYPVAREDEIVLALQRFSDLQSNQEEFQTILAHTGLSGSTTFSNEQKLFIYRAHKELNAIFFELVEDRYRFQIQTGMEGQAGQVITATINSRGSIEVLERQEGFPTCPICLAAGTWIDTPDGPVRVEQLRVGDRVWTANAAGEREPATILQLGSARAPTDHWMIHLTLHDGRELWASGGHPTADGRILAELGLGDVLDGARITGIQRSLYGESHTFDILPSGHTGFYWANGILLGSTMNR